MKTGTGAVERTVFIAFRLKYISVEVSRELWGAPFPTKAARNTIKKTYEEKRVLSSRCLLKLPQEPECCATLQHFDTVHWLPQATGHQTTAGHSVSHKLNTMIRVEYKFGKDSCQSTLWSWLCFISRSWNFYPWSGQTPALAQGCSVSLGGCLATKQQSQVGRGDTPQSTLWVPVLVLLQEPILLFC